MRQGKISSDDCPLYGQYQPGQVLITFAVPTIFSASDSYTLYFVLSRWLILKRSTVSIKGL